MVHYALVTNDLLYLLLICIELEVLFHPFGGVVAAGALKLLQFRQVLLHRFDLFAVELSVLIWPGALFYLVLSEELSVHIGVLGLILRCMILEVHGSLFCCYIFFYLAKIQNQFGRLFLSILRHGGRVGSTVVHYLVRVDLDSFDVLLVVVFKASVAVRSLTVVVLQTLDGIHCLALHKLRPLKVYF